MLAKGMARSALIISWAAGMLVAGENPAPGQQPGQRTDYTPNVGQATKDAELAIQGFRKAKGLTIDLFAAEPLVANPVAFCVDEHNRLYVAETYRYHAGVTDTRRHMNWLDEDLAARTVEDRIAMYRKYLGKELATYGVEHDRIRRLQDRDGDGKADHSEVFADGFNGIEEGFGAGVLVRGSEVWYTCIPRLWKLRDTNGDGRADERVALHQGYGVHVSYLGHDMHGLRQGPDGKLYFSIGDRGLNVKTDDGQSVVALDSGSVLRCNPDGTGLEIFATGLRNPQELAFDEHGNLFTCDNNSDGGDKARWVYVVEGGDSGWRVGYQFLETPVSRGPWNDERLWDPKTAREAYYIVPPIANISDGPSGLTYNPGTGLGERYRQRFFLCDFRGTASQSGIRTFANRPKGASFELIDAEELAWGILATDVDFGPDGALYVTDWVEKFSSPAKGRIYRLSTATLAADPVVREVKTVLAEGMNGRSHEKLAALLEHADARIRLEAQFALAKQGSGALPTFARVSHEPGSRLARLHAIWGLGQIEPQAPSALEVVAGLLTDPDTEVKAQAAKVVGEARFVPAFAGLIALLRDEQPRVRFFAAIALGKLRKREAVSPLLAMLNDNKERDPYLRHAGVMGLTEIGDADALLAAVDHSSREVRLGVLLALRRLRRPELARFLNDGDKALVLEAARAINDVPIEAALPQLAALSGQPDLPAPVLRRVLNANFRLGARENAKSLAAIAARPEITPSIRAEAVGALGNWAKPSGRDLVMGLWRPIDPRSPEPAASALASVIDKLLNEAPELVRLASARSAAKLGLRAAAPSLLALVSRSQSASATRVEALLALQKLESPELTEAMERAADDRDGKLRAAGLHLIAKLHHDEAVQRLANLAERDSIPDRQIALRTLGSIEGSKADHVISGLLDRLIEGHVPPELALDVLEIARARHTPEIEERLAKYESRRPGVDALGRYLETMHGGNAAAGRKIFFEKIAVACVRCHKIDGRGGEVGPDLSGVGDRKNRRFLLESIVDPDREITQGFETRIVATTQGQTHVGVLKSEDRNSITLMSLDGKLMVIPKGEIDDQKKGRSGMPNDLTKWLSHSELRDLIEFLANTKQKEGQAARR